MYKLSVFVNNDFSNNTLKKTLKKFYIIIYIKNEQVKKNNAKNDE